MGLPIDVGGDISYLISHRAILVRCLPKSQSETSHLLSMEAYAHTLQGKMYGGIDVDGNCQTQLGCHQNPLIMSQMHAPDNAAMAGVNAQGGPGDLASMMLPNQMNVRFTVIDMQDEEPDTINSNHSHSHNKADTNNSNNPVMNHKVSWREGGAALCFWAVLMWPRLACTSVLLHLRASLCNWLVIVEQPLRNRATAFDFEHVLFSEQYRACSRLQMLCIHHTTAAHVVTYRKENGTIPLRGISGISVGLLDSRICNKRSATWG